MRPEITSRLFGLLCHEWLHGKTCGGAGEREVEANSILIRCRRRSHRVLFSHVRCAAPRRRCGCGCGAARRASSGAWSRAGSAACCASSRIPSQLPARRTPRLLRITLLRAPHRAICCIVWYAERRVAKKDKRNCLKTETFGDYEKRSELQTVLPWCCTQAEWEHKVLLRELLIKQI